MALPEVGELLADHQPMHSDLQMDHFITIRSGGTLYGCYKQALRELHTRVTGLRNSYEQRDLLRIKIDELESTLGDGDEFAKRRRKVKLRSKKLILADVELHTADQEREFRRFYGQAVALRKALAANGATFPIDAETRDRLDREMWAHRLKAMAAIDLMAHGRIGVNCVEFFQALPVDMRRPLAAEIFSSEKQNQLITWYLEYAPSIPSPAAIEVDDVRRLLPC